MRKYGLVGFSLAHSFSPKFFSDFFAENYIHATYEPFEISSVSLISEVFKSMPDGLNVTIPYKEHVLPYLDFLDDEANKLVQLTLLPFQQTIKSDLIQMLWGLDSL